MNNRLDINRIIAGSGPNCSNVFKGYLALKSGLDTDFKPCAIAREIAAQGVEHGKVIEAFGKYGLSTSDVAEVSEALVSTLVKKFPKPMHRKLSKFSAAADFRNTHLLMGFEDVKSSKDYHEGGEIPYSVAMDAEHETTATRRKPTRVILPYELQRNLTDWVNTIPAAILAGMYREEAADFYGLLEANPILKDGNPLFYDDNTTSSGLLSVDGIITLFRAQKIKKTALIVGAEPAFLLVPSPKEIEVRTELKASGLNDSIEVIARADINNMYLLADPEVSPTLVRLGINDAPEVFVEPVPGMNRALAVRGENDYSFAPVSRYGICRLTLT